MSTKLDDDQILRHLDELPGWQREGDALVRTLTFTDFVEAFGFLSRVALHAERRNHHPEITNIYKTVHLRLTSHDIGGVSDRDIDLARAIDGLL